MSQFKDYTRLEATIMMLINGVGTARLNKNAELVPPPRWNICVVSTGNNTPMIFAGGKVNVAADIRIFNIAANNPELGVLNELHKFKTSYDFVKHINKLSPNPIFHEYLIRVIDLTRHDISRLKNKHSVITQSLIDGKAVHGQVYRVAEKFAAMQLAGELATELEIWSLPVDEIQKSVKIIFEAWVAEFGSNDKEHEQILEQFISGIQSKLAKFIDLRSESYATSIPDPLYGYYDDEYYYLTAYGKSTLLNGFNIKYALEILQQKNLLVRWPSNSFTKVKRIGDRTEKLYFISRANLASFLKQE
jgi:putative DNA primase/helicase